MKTPMSSLFQYKIKTFWKQQTANLTANSKQRQHLFSHMRQPIIWPKLTKTA